MVPGLIYLLSPDQVVATIRPLRFHGGPEEWGRAALEPKWGEMTATLLPGAEVRARGLRWRIVLTEALGQPTLDRLRALRSGSPGEEVVDSPDVRRAKDLKRGEVSRPLR